MSRYKNLSTERKRCWRSHKIQNETATTTDAVKKEFVCSSLEISLQCLNCSYLDVVYKKNILSIRWLHLTILIALFYFIYLNQLHHFLLYRNFHTLFCLFFSLTNPTIPRINCFFSFASTAMNLSLPLLMCVSVFFFSESVSISYSRHSFYFHLHLVY